MEGINILQLNTGETTIGAAELFKIGGITITNSATAGIFGTLVIFLVVYLLNRSYKSEGVPSKLQLVFEMMITGFYGLIKSITGSEKIARKIFPVIGTVFIYIAVSNLLINIIPGIAAINIGGETIEGLPSIFKTGGESLFRTHTNDYSVTFGIAAAVVIWTHIYSIEKNNIFGHLNKYFRFGALYKGFRQGIGPGMMSIIDFMLGLLDIISEFAKSLSLSIRLFGNMFAGELLSALLLSAFALVAPTLLIFMGLFTGVIQALVFGALTTSYFGIALADD